MPIIAYLNFNGNAREVLAIYADVFKASPAKMMTYQDMPGAEQIPDFMKSMVLHAEMNLHGTTIYAADTPNDGTHPFLIGNQVTLSIQTKSMEEAKSIYTKLSEGGTVHTPLGPTFFSPAYAEFSDRFRIRWMIITE